MRIVLTSRRRQSRLRARVAGVGFAVGAVLGAIGSFFLDPVRGRQRRKQTADRAARLVRRTSRRVLRLGGRSRAWGAGTWQRLRHRSDAPKDLDDASLAHKVETEVFRAPDVPKGQINVNAQHGVVQLRGEVPTPEMIAELVERTRAVRGVESVENLLHLPGTPAPMHQ
jgi:osmotically-inducible protein OsmY